MAIITPPAPLPLRRIGWRLSFPAQVNRSGWTGRRKVVGLPGANLWSATAEFVPQVGEARARRWRGFFASLRGQQNSFPLLATEGPQFATPADCSVFGEYGAGATSLQILGPAFAPPLAAGTLIGIGGFAHSLNVDTAQGGGADLRVASIGPGLRAFTPHATPVRIDVAAVYGDTPAGVRSMTLIGAIGERQLAAGEMLTIAGQLVVLTRDSAPAGGANLRSVTFEPELRAYAPNFMVVERARPFAMMTMTEPVGWDVDVGQVYGFPCAFEEAL